MRYFFHIAMNDRLMLDGTGVLLPDLSAAIDEAESTAQDIMESADLDWSRWSVEVRDDKGDRLFAFPFTGPHRQGYVCSSSPL